MVLLGCQEMRLACTQPAQCNLAQGMRIALVSRHGLVKKRMGLSELDSLSYALRSLCRRSECETTPVSEFWSHVFHYSLILKTIARSQSPSIL